LPLSLSSTAEIAEGSDRTFFTDGIRATAERLRVSHEEGVVLLIGRELSRNMLLEEILNRSVLASPKEADSRPDAFL